jgi:outer membrane protein assembly factor BamB
MTAPAIAAIAHCPPRARACRVAILALASALQGGCAGQGTEPPPSTGAIIWRVRMDVPVGWARTPILLRDFVIFPQGTGIRALHLEDGREAWRSEPLLDLPVGPRLRNLAVADSTVYAAHDYELVALSGTTGAVRWRFRAPPPDTGAFLSETLADARSIFTAARAHVYALDPATQAIQWHRDLAADWHGRGVVRGFATSGDTLFVTAGRHRTADTFSPATVVLALDRRTGAQLWYWETDVLESVPTGSPILAGPFVLALDYYGGQLYALDRASGVERWRFETMPEYMGPFDAAVRDGTVYVASGDTHVHAVDLGTGRARWKTGTGASNSRIALCGRNVIAQRLGYAILDASTGRLLFSGGDYSEGDYTLSGFAVRDGIAFVTGSEYAEAFRCDRR